MPERRSEFVRVTAFEKRCTWIINYKLWALCGCYYNRYTIEVRFEPTLEQIESLIHEDKNKR